MATAWQVRERNRELLSAESGTVRREASLRVALVYPSPYRAAMSSLGYQAIYRALNEAPEVAADRAVLPDDVQDYRRGGVPLLTLERELPVGDYPVVAFSVAYELELTGVIECLELAGIPPLATDRDGRHPLVVAGGPLTFSNPLPLAPFCDVVVVGEAETAAVEVVRAAAYATDRPALLARLAATPGCFVPSLHGEQLPPIARVDAELLPARSSIVTPHAELASMFLVEAGRGCSRGCTYCVMRRSAQAGIRVVPSERILAAIPAWARRVGLVGAAVTDHPHIVEVVRAIVRDGREIGISSLRADRLSDELVALLAAGGYRTLTVAADGASARLRGALERRTSEEHLLRAAELAHRHRLAVLKVYMMVGVPGEEDADIDELVRFTLELARIHPRVALGVAPFVSKRNTPLADAPFAGVATVERKLSRLREGLRGRAEVRATSARWAWVEHQLAQGGAVTGLTALAAWQSGGTLAAWKRALASA